MTILELIYQKTGLKISKTNFGIHFISGEIYSIHSIFNIQINRKLLKNFLLLKWKIVLLPILVEKIILDPGISLKSKMDEEDVDGNILILHRENGAKFYSKIKLGGGNFKFDIEILGNKDFVNFTLELCSASLDQKFFKTKYKPLRKANIEDKIHFYFDVFFPRMFDLYGFNRVKLRDFLTKFKFTESDLESWYKIYGLKFPKENINKVIPICHVYGGPIFKDMYQTARCEMVLLDFERVMLAPMVHDYFRIPIKYRNLVKKNHMKYFKSGDLPLIDQLIICAFFIHKCRFQPKWAREVKDTHLASYIEALRND